MKVCKKAVFTHPLGRLDRREIGVSTVLPKWAASGQPRMPAAISAAPEDARSARRKEKEANLEGRASPRPPQSADDKHREDKGRSLQKWPLPTWPLPTWTGRAAPQPPMPLGSKARQEPADSHSKVACSHQPRQRRAELRCRVADPQTSTSPVLSFLPESQN